MSVFLWKGAIKCRSNLLSRAGIKYLSKNHQKILTIRRNSYNFIGPFFEPASRDWKILPGTFFYYKSTRYYKR